MVVTNDFEVKHFVQFTKMYGGTLEIIYSDGKTYTALYRDGSYTISPDALSQIKLLNQNLKVENRIVQ